MGISNLRKLDVFVTMMYLSPQQRCALEEPTSHTDSHTFTYDPIEAERESERERERERERTVKRIAMRIKLAHESSDGEDCCETKPDNPGILLPPKREKNHERHVNFPPPSPNVQSGSDESTSGFLNLIFSKMQFACGSPNQVVECGERG